MSAFTHSCYSNTPRNIQKTIYGSNKFITKIIAQRFKRIGFFAQHYSCFVKILFFFITDSWHAIPL